MNAAMDALDAAYADYRRYSELGDVSEQVADALADAADAVLRLWDFGRGIVR